MGSPYSFPGAEGSDFMNLYQQFMQDPSRQLDTNYLDPDDPDLLSYMQRSAEPTGSEEMIREYVGRRPSYEEYDPGIGRKMASFLLGTLSGGGYGAAQKHLYAPLEQGIEDWEREGTSISARARLMDAERKRELNAQRFGLSLKTRAARQQTIDEQRKRTEARRMADEVAGEAERKETRTFREGIATDLSEARRERIDLTKQRDADRAQQTTLRNTEREESRIAQDEEDAEEEASLGNINKRLSAYASQRGIQTKIKQGGRATDMTAYDIANTMAHEDAMNYSAFKNLITKGKKGWTLTPLAGKQPELVEAMVKWISKQKEKYLLGEGF